MNKIVGEGRTLVSDVAGTTRDAIDTPFNYNGKPYVLIDTAGMRRRGKIKIDVALDGGEERGAGGGKCRWGGRGS